MADKPVLLLSDLHLPPKACPYREAFLRFLRGPARSATAIYILGDLFDAWIGDDAGLTDYAPECAQLAHLAMLGIAVYLQRGNRDFLIGEKFAEQTGVRLLPEYVCIELPIGRTLLTHGDGLCIDDVAFQRFRYWTQKPPVRFCFLHLPLRMRRRIGNALQQASKRAKDGKTNPVMDVNRAAVCRVLHDYGVNRLIHGHTHNPGRYVVDNSMDLERVVLPDWRPGQTSYVICDGAGLRTKSVP